MIVSAYCRVSTDSKDQLNSLDNQLSYFSREIEAKGHTLYKIYYDEGLTGTKLNNRPDFDRMLQDAGIDVKVIVTNKNDARVKNKHTVYEISDRVPLFNEIWIKNTSRFARNTLSYEIITLLRQKHVNIFFIEQNINSNDMAQDMLLKLMQIFDEQDSKDKSLKIRTGIRESAKRGRIRTNSKFYGYKYIKSENRLEIIPEEAKIVKTVFELSANGKGFRQIINYLNDHKMFTRNGKPFVNTSIKRMLDNEKYFGYNNPLKIDDGKVFEKYTYSKIRDDYKIMLNDRIPAIIDKSLYDKCKSMTQLRINKFSKVGEYKGISKYCNFIYCDNCGAVYYKNTVKQHDGSNKGLYNCKNKRQHGVKFCNNPNVYENKIDEYIQNLADYNLHDIIYNEKIQGVNIIFNIIKFKFEQMNQDNNDEANNVLNQINENQQILDNYYELYSRQKISQEGKNRLLNKIESIESIIESLKNQFSELTKENDTIESEILELYSLSLSIENIDINKQKYTVDEVLTIVEKLIIRKSEVDGDFEIIPKIKHIVKIEDILNKYNYNIQIVKLSNIDLQMITDKILALQPNIVIRKM